MCLQTQPFDPVNVAYSSYQFRCDVYKAAKSKKAAPIRPSPIPSLSAPLDPVWVATAPEPVAVPLDELVAVELALEDVFVAAEAAEDVLEEETELADDATEAEEADDEEAAEVTEADEDAEEEAAAEVAVAPVPVEVSWAVRRDPTLETQVPATFLLMS